ncbi:MAG: response regulator [Pseudomonadota bacterium]
MHSKILIVDDEPRMCDSLKALLTNERYETRTCYGGHEALECLARNNFDLVLVDMVMPDVNGHQIVDYINSQNPETCVIVITGHATVDSAIESLRKGACDYLRKPFEYEELLKTAEKALDQKRFKSERKRVEQALRAARDELEQRVKERTADLVTANEQLKREIEQRKRAEKQICRLSHELLMAQESERQRISRELHDVVGQDLSALKIGLDTFFDNQPEAPPETRQRLSEFSKILKGAIATVRDLSHTLRSTGLDQRGLVSTVRLYCEEFSDKNRVKVNFFATGIDESRLDFHTKINLYRMIQEGLNNVKKHADANHVTIRLMGSFPNIILRIEDDGKGFDVQDRLISAANERRMGLRVMEERAALLQGKMKIETYLKQGTKIVVEVPYKEKNIGRKENRLDC